MKKDRLYTANKWNKNLLAIGGETRNFFGDTKDEWNALTKAQQKFKIDTYKGTDAYLQHKNMFGVTREKNALSSVNLGNTLGSAASAAATVASPILTKAIGGGYSTGGVGEGVATLGNQVGQAVGGPWGAVISVGSGIVGGGINRLFGTKWDEKLLNDIQENMYVGRSVGNALSKATTSEDYFRSAGQMTTGIDFDYHDLGSTGVLKSNRVLKNKAKELQSGQDAALAAQRQGAMLGAIGVDRATDDLALANSHPYAFGGLLEDINNNNMGALEFGLAADYVNNYRRKTNNNNTSTNMFAGMPASFFAEGGPKGSKMKKWMNTSLDDVFYPDNNTGTYGGGKGTGGGAGTKNWDLPEYETTIKNDTIWVPIERNFNDAFRDAARRGLTEFEFNGGTYPVEYADKEGWEEAGNARKEVIGAIPVTAERKTTTRKKAEGGPINVLNPYCGGGKMFALGGPDNLPQFLRYAGALGSALSVLPKNTTVEPELTAPTRRDVQPSDLSSILLKEYSKPYPTAVKQSRVSPILRSEYAPLGEVYRQAALENENKARQIAEFNRSVNGLNNTAFALGGDMQTNGADWTTGLTHIDAGQSHELNPYEGVQVGVDSEGTPNLVEENETIFNDYVYSNRIKCDDQTKEKFRINKKRDITFADLSKKLEKESLERPNDPISTAALKIQMEKLANEQERQKAEAEAQRAKEAFEALNPEEQISVMQQLQAQEQAAQEAAMQEQAMAQQQAIQGQQVPPEMAQPTQEDMLAQEQLAQQQMTQQPVMAYGGKLFDKGGDMKKLLYGILGINTDSDYKAWLKKNNLDKLSNAEDWENILSNKDIMAAVSKDNPALADAIANGYDFGQYVPERGNKATIQSINRGNWKATNGKGWMNSEDLAFKQATEGLSDQQIEALTTEQLAERMRATDAYKNTSKWLENADNALLYLNTLYNDAETPQVAKDYAAKFIKDGKWKDGFKYDYATVFGSNGKGVRETDPGTYWHTALEANRGNKIVNRVINEDGTVEDIIGDVPTDWTSAGSYNWANPDNDYTYNYFSRPVSKSTDEVVPGKAAETEAKVEAEKKYKPILKNEKLRYAGLLGPAVGLGLMAADVGKPDFSGLDSILESYNSRGAYIPQYRGIGNYLAYRPMDIWANQNRMNANARATDKAIINNSGPLGTQMAGLLASNYNDQLGSGELYRQALEYNDNKRAQVGEFNRGTDQFNASAFNQNEQTKANILNADKQYKAQLASNIAAQKMDADAGWYNSLYGNIGGLFNSIANIGKENAQHNMIARMAADGLFGNMTDKQNIASNYLKAIGKKGGKLRRRKGGLTI